MSKVLFTASITKHLIRFHKPYLKWFKDNGYEVHIASSGDDEIPFVDKKWEVPFVRSPYSVGHYKAYKCLKKLIDKEGYDLIHCHTPMASIVTRLAAKDARRNGTKVLYTAHGFHFYKGAPLKNWLFYYPIEKIFSSQVDGIVTINREDYQLLVDKKFKTQYIYQINGIGVNPGKFVPVSDEIKNELRTKLGYKPDQFILLYAAEFIHRKNHKFIIDLAKDLSVKIPNLKILFAGRGIIMDQMEKYASNKGVLDCVDFMGFRYDIDNVVQIADVGISASRQEGLGLNLIEEMYCGLPVVATVDRGHREIIEHGENGFLFAQNNKEEFIQYVTQLYAYPDLRSEFGKRSLSLATKFSIETSLNEMAKIYKQILNS